MTDSGSTTLSSLSACADEELFGRGRDGDHRAYEVVCARHSYLAGRLIRQVGLGAERSAARC